MDFSPGRNACLLIITAECVIFSGMESKQSTSLRLTAEAKRLLALLAKKRGISLSATLELAIRSDAKREGVK